MHYRVVIFGVKDTTAEIVRFVQEKLCPVDLVVTIHPDVLSGNQVSGYEGLSWLEDKYGIPVYETHSYGLKDEETTKFPWAGRDCFPALCFPDFRSVY